MRKDDYTKKQRDVIDGLIPLESVNGQFLRWFYQKALSNNDDELADTIKARMDVLKAEAYERTKARSRIRSNKITRNETIRWRQPKCNEYTDQEKSIIKGEIPFSTVHTNSLISIHQKACNVGDYELSERIYDLITDRRMCSQKRNKQSHKYYGTQKISQEFAAFVGVDANLPLTSLEKAMLLGYEDLSDSEGDRIYQVVCDLRAQGDEHSASVIESLVLCNKNSFAFLSETTHEEAINRIEELLQLPIRRPQTWFCQEETKKEDG